MTSELTLDNVRLYPVKNLNKENARIWVDALRNGRMSQVTGLLSKKKESGRWGYCCLGVACEVAGVPKVNEPERWDGAVIRKYDGSDSLLPVSVRRWLGITSADPSVKAAGYNSVSLASLNDDHDWTFKMIAALIERDWLNGE